LARRMRLHTLSGWWKPNGVASSRSIHSIVLRNRLDQDLKLHRARPTSSRNLIGLSGRLELPLDAFQDRFAAWQPAFPSVPHRRIGHIVHSPPPIGVARVAAPSPIRRTLYQRSFSASRIQMQIATDGAQIAGIFD
jgi:hypothetical protein